MLGKGSKRRSVPVGAAALQALRQWLAMRSGWAREDQALFINQRGTRLTPQHIRVRLKQRSLKAGLATPVHPHMTVAFPEGEYLKGLVLVKRVGG